MPNYSVHVLMAGGAHTERYNEVADDPKAAAKKAADKWTADVEKRLKGATGRYKQQLERVRVPSLVEVIDAKTHRVIETFKVHEI